MINVRTYPEYKVWAGMKQRCLNTNHQAYKDYGGRGITVCPEWRKSFLAFLRYVGRRPSEAHSIDRWPNNNGGYEPGNVRWAIPIEQANNRRVAVARGGQKVASGVVEMLKAGNSQSDTARCFGISRQRVSQIAIRNKISCGLNYFVDSH